MRRRLPDSLSSPLWGQADFDLAPQATALPFAAEGERQRKTARRFFLLAGILAVICALTIAASGGSEEGSVPAVVLGVLAVVAGVAGAYHWTRRQRWEFDRAHVKCHTRSILMRRDWEEPLSAYLGIVSVTTMKSFHLGEGARDRHPHILVLQHRTNPVRSVKLYGSDWPDDLWAKQTHYGRLFSLPGLIETSGGIVLRQTVELGKSVRQRVAEGTLRVSFDPTRKPKGGLLQVQMEKEGLVLRAGRQAWGVVGRLFPPALMVSGAGMAVLGFILGPWSHGFLTVMGATQMALGVGTRLAFWLAPEELAVSVEGVCRRRRHPWGTFGKLSIPAESIEDVAVREPTGEGKNTVVQVISRAGTIRFGALLSEEEKEWVRDCIIAVISK